MLIVLGGPAEQQGRHSEEDYSVRKWEAERAWGAERAEEGAGCQGQFGN